MTIEEHELVDYQMFVGLDEDGYGEVVPIRARVRVLNQDMAKIEVLEEDLPEWYGQRWTVPVSTLTRVAQ